MLLQSPTAAKLLDCAAFVIGGVLLRALGILSERDAEVSIAFAGIFTAPSLLLQAVARAQVPVSATGIIFLASVACTGIVAPLTRYVARPGNPLLRPAWFSSEKWGWSRNFFKARSVSERALLQGSCSSLAVSSAGLAVSAAAFGGQGLHLASVWHAANLVAVAMVRGLAMGEAQAQRPETYEHEDGSVYRGQWRGQSKHGLGTYRYPNGARYEGTWLDNVKHGHGVYTFPKGGLYEGEWQGGDKWGLGVRLLRSGDYKAGRWQRELQTVLPLEQCAQAAAAARQSASLARRVKVGGGRWAAAKELALQPVPWALLGGLTLAGLRIPLPEAMDVATAYLGAAHVPLMLLCSGVLAASLPQIPARKSKDVLSSLRARYAVPQLAAAAAAAIVPAAWLSWVACGSIVAASPIPLQADEAGTAGRQLASTLAAVTALTSAALMPAMALALAASHTRQAIAGVCLATAGLSWAALPAVWTWLAARSGPAADRMQKFVAAPGPVARRRGQAPAQQEEGSGGSGSALIATALPHGASVGSCAQLKAARWVHREVLPRPAGRLKAGLQASRPQCAGSNRVTCGGLAL